MAGACMGVVLAAPCGAMALSTHSATVRGGFEELVATAKCGVNEHVVSGGFGSSIPAHAAGEAVSHAGNHHEGWTVALYTVYRDTLTAYAYCARIGELPLATRRVQVPASPPGGSSIPAYNTVATAHCGSGETLVSGGFALHPDPGFYSATYRDYASSAGKWKVMALYNYVPPPGALAAFAYCGRGVVVKVRSRSSGLIPDNGKGSATVSCHTGETLLGGGFTTTPTPDPLNSSGPDPEFGSSYRSGARSWTATAKNYSSASGKITAFAYCMP